MGRIYWRMNATQGGSNLHMGVNLLPGANCAHEHCFRYQVSAYRTLGNGYSFQYLLLSLI